MTFDAQSFRRAYVRQGGSVDSANSYVSYLNRVDGICGGIEERFAREGGPDLIAWLERQPSGPSLSVRNLRDGRTALKRYIALRGNLTQAKACRDGQTSNSAAASVGVGDLERNLSAPDASTVRQLLADARALAARYYAAFNKPLGATGEIAELTAAELLGIELTPARTPGHDGLMERDGNVHRVQIKGRAVAPDARYRGPCPSIKCGGFDLAMLVLLDRRDMAPLEIWEATACEVARKLAVPGSRARNDRSSLAISQFISGRDSPAGEAPRKVWPYSA